MNRNKIIKIVCYVLLLVLLLAYAIPKEIPAFRDRFSMTDEDADITYQVEIDDAADLLTSEQEQSLRGVMDRLTSYGNVLFLTSYLSDSDYNGYTDRAYRSRFGSEPGLAFLIDMGGRKLWFKAFEGPSYVLDNSICYEITDRSYRYASGGDYYGCAEKTFEEAEGFLDGGLFIKDMKIFISILLALITALFINLARLIASRNKSRRKYGNSPAIYGGFIRTADRTVLTKHTKHRYVESSGGGGGGGGGGFSGGGGGGGGGHSSGGGHSF